MKKSQTCQYDQWLYVNEYNSYLFMIEYQQLNNEVIFILDEEKDIWHLNMVYNTFHLSPKRFRAIKEIKKHGIYGIYSINSIYTIYKIP